MRFDTRFSLGQTVHVFARKTRNISDPCDVCGGHGRVTFTKPNGDEDTTYCPGRCSSGRVRVIAYGRWEYAGTAIVGQVEVKASTRPGPFADDPTYVERYMLDTTGIGSGTVYPYVPGEGWTNSNLFETEWEGQEWADEQNDQPLAEAEAKLAEERSA